MYELLNHMYVLQKRLHEVQDIKPYIQVIMLYIRLNIKTYFGSPCVYVLQNITKFVFVTFNDNSTELNHSFFIF